MVYPARVYSEHSDSQLGAGRARATSPTYRGPCADLGVGRASCTLDGNPPAVAFTDPCGAWAEVGEGAQDHTFPPGHSLLVPFTSWCLGRRTEAAQDAWQGMAWDQGARLSGSTVRHDRAW